MRFLLLQQVFFRVHRVDRIKQIFVCFCSVPKTREILRDFMTQISATNSRQRCGELSWRCCVAIVKVIDDKMDNGWDSRGRQNYFNFIFVSRNSHFWFRLATKEESSKKNNLIAPRVFNFVWSGVWSKTSWWKTGKIKNKNKKKILKRKSISLWTRKPLYVLQQS